MVSAMTGASSDLPISVSSYSTRGGMVGNMVRRTIPSRSSPRSVIVNIRCEMPSIFRRSALPAIKLVIDFGPVLGRKRSSAQITEHYDCDGLIGRQVAAVVNFPPRQIGKFVSEVLTLGFPDDAGAVVLFAPDRRVPDGGRLF